MNPNQEQIGKVSKKKSKLPYLIGCLVLCIVCFLILVTAILGYLIFTDTLSIIDFESDSEYFGKVFVPSSQDLRFGVNQGIEARQIDPHKAELNKIVPALFDGLAEYNNETARLSPSLATKWEKNSDATVWKFYLRKEAKWSNGESITASDFVYSWKRFLRSEIASRKAFLLYDVKNAEDYNAAKADAKDVGIEAIDDHTLQVTFRKPVPYFDKLIADPALRVVRKETVEEYGDKWTEPQNIVTSGAYKPAESEKDDQIVVVKNQQFWDSDEVSLETITFITNNANAIERYEIGEIDAIELSTPDMKAFSSKSIVNKKDFFIHKILGVEFVYLNTNKKPLDNVKVRKALNLAIDQSNLNEQRISEFPTSGFVPKMDGYENPKEPEYDLAKAKQLLSEAGYPNGEGFPEIEYIYNTNESNERIAKFLQKQWQENLGINTKLKRVEWKTYLVMLSEGEYKGVARGGWNADYADPYSFLSLLTMSESIEGWNDQKFIDILEKANSTTENSQRYTLLAEAESYLLEQQAVIPLSNNFRRLLSKPYVKGIAINPENKINWREVSIETNFVAE